MSDNILDGLKYAKSSGQKKIGILIDPDKILVSEIKATVNHIESAGVDYILLGGSLLTTSGFQEIAIALKNHLSIPLLLFPSTTYQLTEQADAVLFLSLISGRNADLLIGKQVEATPLLRHLAIEIIPTGYLLINGGVPTTASYISNTNPIPNNKPEIAATTALAGQYLGLQIMYLDAGSGASVCVSSNMIKKVRQTCDTPIIVGGGIRTPEQAYQASLAGADLVIIGTAFEEDATILNTMVKAVKKASTLTQAEIFHD